MAQAKKKKATTAKAKGKAKPLQYVVGVGSSAGGLEALSELANSLPLDLNAAFVVVQHMSPQHKSLMTALLSRETKMPVYDVSEGLTL